jgi:tetratricopeptide (TPR) repeat protein
MLMSAAVTVLLQGQSASIPAHAAGAAVQGSVRDSAGHPLAGAKVSLKAKNSGTFDVSTDATGAFSFSGVLDGDYTLRAEMAGYAVATVGPFTYARHESKTVNLTLEANKKSQPQKSPTGRPEFFDEPQFTVAGVTDTTNLGGHGSDTIVKNRDAIARDTASLAEHPSGVSSGASADPTIEKSLREAVNHQPNDFETNSRLGKVLVDEGKSKEALTYLEKASSLKPRDYQNNYQLARARADSGDYEGARVHVMELLSSSDKSSPEEAEAHDLLGELSEKLKEPLTAVKEYQRAAELNPSEPYLFDWGAELLLHHAAEPAVEVFTKGNRLFPRSARMLTGLGASLYALGSYDQAVQRLCEASDLNPDDPNPYLFIGKMQAVEATPSEAIRQGLERFARLHPENALANYYYAVSVLKGRESSADDDAFIQVKALLEKAVRLDPTLGVAYLQLGILYSERKDLSHAVAAYKNATRVTPDLEDAHYRLAQAYRQSGEPSKAQAELQLYVQISKDKAAEIERQRHEVQQFVYELNDSTKLSKPQSQAPKNQ